MMRALTAMAHAMTLVALASSTHVGALIRAQGPTVSPPVYELALPPDRRLYELVRPTPQPAAVRPSPIAPAAPVARTTGSWTTVPILMYHYIRTNPDPRDRVGFGLSVTPAMFRAQLDYLAQNGFHVVSLHQTVEAIRLHRPLPSRPVVLTFDDGYADFYTTAVPELRRHGFTATEFVVSGFVGRPGYLTWAQIQAVDGLGFTIGAHTVNHVALASVAPARAVWEMRQSKLTLESTLHHPVLDLAYPYGSFTPSVAAEARQLGFECAVSTLPGNRHGSDTLLTLHRVRIGGGIPLAAFARLVGA
jgi:peptidoglycan/xylan/chitin deacetylase (PgdA/CDA1 family)